MDDLHTARLVLHPLSIGEARRVAAAKPDDTTRWARGYPTQGDVIGAWRYVNLCAIIGDPQPFGAYEIRRRDDGQAIGGLGFHAAPDEHGGVTIGYGLIPDVRGLGYATEALRELLRLARTHGVA